MQDGSDELLSKGQRAGIARLTTEVATRIDGLLLLDLAHINGSRDKVEGGVRQLLARLLFKFAHLLGLVLDVSVL